MGEPAGITRLTRLEATARARQLIDGVRNDLVNPTMDELETAQALVWFDEKLSDVLTALARLLHTSELS